MGRDGTATRNKILEHSRQLIYDNGFAGTSIDQILERTGITKGTFFYHFKTKNALADALISLFARQDQDELNKALELTKELSDQPVKRLLKFVDHFISMMEEVTESIPSCLYASYTYEPNQFDDDIKQIIADAMLNWRKEMKNLLEAAVQEKVPKAVPDITSLADLFTVIFEGSFVMSRALRDPQLTAGQLRSYRQYLELLFDTR
jgi:TetR/AcrR family transcriptional repressor of nem operon